MADVFFTPDENPTRVNFNAKFKQIANMVDDVSSTLSTKPGQNLLDNSVFLDGCLVDQRQGRVVKPNTTYYSDNQLATSAGTTSAYVTAYRYATGEASGVNYASFKLENTDTAPTYYAAPGNVVRGYTGAGYTVDRWKMWIDVGTILIEPDGILLDATDNAITWSQMAESSLLSILGGKTVTMSILYTAVTALTPATAIMVNTTNGVVNPVRLGTDEGVTDCRSGTFTFPSNGTHPAWVYVAKGQKVKIHAIKLELGSQQTLAHQENGKWVLNELPNYADTLARCQRYQRKIFISRLNAICVGTQMIEFCLNDVLTGMRATPALTLFGKQMDTPIGFTDGYMGVIPGGNGNTGWNISAGTTYSPTVINNGIVIKASIPESAFTVTPTSGLSYALHCGKGVYVFADANL